MGPAIPWSPPAPEPPKPPGAPAIGPAAAPPGPAQACPGTGLWPVPAPSGRFFLSALLLLPAPAFAGFPGAPGPPGGPSGRPLLFQLPDACAQSSGLGFQSVQGLELLGSRLRPAGPGAGGRICCTDICFSALAGLQPERGGRAVVSRGHQLIQPLAQGPHPGSLQIPAPEKTGALVHAALHSQENLTAGVRRQLWDREGRFPSQRPEIGP